MPKASEQLEHKHPVIDRKTTLLETLKFKILCMELAPGASLDETMLSEEFGLSRPPIRELLRELAAEGFIELEANRSPRVTAMNYDSLRHFYQAAPLIFAATTKLAALSATRTQIDKLKDIQQRFRTAIGNGDLNGRVFSNDHFHRYIGEMAGNQYLIPSLNRLQIDHARLARIFYQPCNETMLAELKQAANEHDQIIDAIETRQPQRAEELILSHLDLSRRNMAMYVAPDGVTVKSDILDDILK